MKIARILTVAAVLALAAENTPGVVSATDHSGVLAPDVRAAIWGE